MAAEEPVTIPRSSKHKRRSTRTSENKNIPVKTDDPTDERTLSVSEATPTAVSQEIVNSNSSIVNTKETTNDELVHSAPVTAITEQEKSIVSTTDTQVEIPQVNSTTDVPNSSVNNENLSIEQPDEERANLDKSDHEQYALPNESRPEIIPADKISVLENVESKTSHDQSAVDLSTIEYTTTDTLDQEPYAIKDNNESSQGYPDTENLPSATPDDNSVNVHEYDRQS